MSDFLSPEVFFLNATASSSSSTPPNSTAVTLPGGAARNPFIPPWPVQAVYIVAFATMVVVSAGGNAIVVWIVMAHKRMRTVTNYFLVNLAVADALNSVLNTLFSFVYMLYNDWVFGRGYCKFTQFIVNCTISASVFTFMAIALDRYNAIVHPLKPRMGALCVAAAISAIWTASAVTAFPSLLFAETYAYPGADHVVCYLEWPDGSHSTSDLVYNVFLLIVNYFAPLSALAVTYAVVGWQLWGSEAIGERTTGQEETIRAKRRVVKMLIVVVIIFAVCWLPMHLYFIVGNFYPVQSLTGAQHLYLVIYWVAMSNSMYNPIMYCWMNARFRNGFKYVFRWLPCVHWHWSDALGIGGGGGARRMLVRLSPSGRGGGGGATVYRPGGGAKAGAGADRSGSRQSTVISCLAESPDHEAYLRSFAASSKAPGTGGGGQRRSTSVVAHQNNFHALTVNSEHAF